MSAELEAQLASDLVDAQRRLRALEFTDEQKALAHKRLLAISDASKHDVARAAKRLAALMKDLDEGRISASEH